MPPEDVFGQVDAVEPGEVLGAILQVIDQLKRRAQGVRPRPEALVLPMHVEDETPHGRRRKPAIAHEFAPIGVAGLADVLAEGVEQVEGVPRAKASQARAGCAGVGFRVGRPRPRSAPSR